MAPKPKQKLIIAFDLYGTLLDTASIATDLAQILGPSLLPSPKAEDLAAKWRQYQLEYTFRLAAHTAAAHIPFDAITRASLLHAAQELGIHIAGAKAAELLSCYDSLQTFSDVLPALEALTQHADSARAVVFSNGTPEMLARSVDTAPTLKLFRGKGDGGDEKQQQQQLFGKLISVQATGRYKPAPEVYEHLVREAVDAGADYKARAAVWLVSANAFDVVGARAAGMRAAWVDRKGTGWVDQLGVVVSEGTEGKPDLTPTLVVKGVDEAVDKILAVGV